MRRRGIELGSATAIGGVVAACGLVTGADELQYGVDGTTSTAATEPQGGGGSTSAMQGGGGSTSAMQGGGGSTSVVQGGGGAGQGGGEPCTSETDCPIPVEACKKPVCINGSCTAAPKDKGDACEGTKQCDELGKCVPATCLNGVKDQDESDTDCGGMACSLCGLGKSCIMSNDCSSTHCADGICCDVACTGPCVACNLAGSQGTCTPVAAFSAEAACPSPCGLKQCDGAGKCVCGDAADWAHRLGAGAGGSLGDDRPGGIAALKDDGVLVAGRYVGNVASFAALTSLGQGTCSPPASSAGEDIVVFELDKDQKCSKLVRFASSGTGDDSALALAVDRDAMGVATAVVAAGYFEDTIAFGNGKSVTSSNGTRDGFVASLAPDLDPSKTGWAFRFGGPNSDNEEASAVAVDPMSGKVAVAGFVRDTGVTTTPACTQPIASGGSGSEDVAVFLLDKMGNCLWGKRFAASGSANDHALAVAIGNQGAVIAAGEVGGNIDLGGGAALTSAGGQDAFVASYNADGTHAWSMVLGGAGNDVANAVAVDGKGDLVVAGAFEATLFVPGCAIQSAGGEDVFVAKLAGGGDGKGKGKCLWAVGFGAPSDGSTDDQRALAVAVDGSGNVIVAGEFFDSNSSSDSSSLQIGTTLLTKTGAQDAFVAKLSGADGAVFWAAKYGPSSSNSSCDASGLALATDLAGRLLFAGAFGGRFGNTCSTSFDFGPASHAPNSTRDDMFLLRRAP
jgi:hypothetical protein